MSVISRKQNYVMDIVKYVSEEKYFVVIQGEILSYFFAFLSTSIVVIPSISTQLNSFYYEPNFLRSMWYPL